MTANEQQLVKHLFGTESLDEVSVWQLRELVAEHPYFNIGHYLLSRKLAATNSDERLEASKTTALHFANPLWLQWLFDYRDEQTASIAASIEKTVLAISKTENKEQDIPAATENPSKENNKPEPIKEEAALFEPYHTIDYFASQGIKLSLDDIPRDRFGQQLKSFTDWLKVMKRLPQNQTVLSEDESSDAVIRDIASHSNDEKEVLTEAMADVLARQGKTEKARELYHKLSLLNPDKSAYFAAKIDQIKAY